MWRGKGVSVGSGPRGGRGVVDWKYVAYWRISSGEKREEAEDLLATLLVRDATRACSCTGCSTRGTTVAAGLTLASGCRVVVVVVVLLLPLSASANGGSKSTASCSSGTFSALRSESLLLACCCCCWWKDFLVGFVAGVAAAVLDSSGGGGNKSLNGTNTSLGASWFMCATSAAQWQIKAAAAINNCKIVGKCS